MVEALLRADQHVVGLDNFSTGSRLNIDRVERALGSSERARRFRLIEGDIRDLETCRTACSAVDYMLRPTWHQATLLWDRCRF